MIRREKELKKAEDHPEIGGIITYDKDFKAIATSGLISSKSSKYSKHFFVGNANEFLKKYGLGGKYEIRTLE